MNDAISRALQRSALIAANVKAAASNPLASMGTGAALGVGSSQQNHAREQEKHFSGWVYACVRVIAQRIASQPIRVAKKTSAPSDPKARRKSAARLKGAPSFVKAVANRLEPLDVHPLLTALENPNELMSGFQLLYTVVCHLELSGQSFLYMRDTDGGDLSTGLEIWPLPPSWVKPVHEEGKPFASYKVRLPGSAKEIDIPGEDVARVHYPDPADPLYGAYAPLQAAALAVTTDEHIQAAQAAFFKNGVFPGMAVVIGRQPSITGAPGERPALNRDQRAQITTAIKQAYRGVFNANEPLILDALIEDVKKLTNSAAEMDFMNSSALTKERILQLFGVSPAAMGDVATPNRASSAAADDHLCKNTLSPKCSMISAALTKWVAPRFGGDVVAYIEEPRASDPDSDRADREQLAKYGCITKNELRAAAHMEPHDDGEELVEAGSGGLTLTGPPANG